MWERERERKERVRESERETEGALAVFHNNAHMRCIQRKEMFYLTVHSSHFIYGYMASDIW